MKKLRKPLDEWLPPVRLFIDDVEKIIQIMSKASGDPSFEIKTDEYALDHLNELADLKREWVSELRVRLLEPRIDLDIRRNYVRLYASEDTPTSRGVLAEMKDHLRQKRRRLSISGFEEAWEGYTAFLIPIFLGSILLLARPTVYIMYGGIGLLFAGMLLLFYGSRMSSVVILKRRVEEKSFWQRNRDQILLVIVTAILTFVATLLGTWAAGWLR